MSLATRCTACGTAFRVVQDQLKVSEGWVRCGRCTEVFNALEGLFDLERETAPQWEPPPPDGTAPADGAAAAGESSEPSRSADVDHHLDFDRQNAITGSVSSVRPDVVAGIAAVPAARPAGATDVAGMPDTVDTPDKSDTAPLEPPAATDSARPSGDRDLDRAIDEETGDASDGEASLDEEIDAHLFGARHDSRRRAPKADVSERDRLDFSDARFDSDLMADDTDVDDRAAPAQGRDTGEMPLESATAPEFLRRADARARWQRPQTRAALAVASLALLATLVLQIGHHFHDFAAARWPALRPVLVEWCALAACSIEAPRRIDDISVESSALARAADADSFQLSVTLRSRASLPLALPWVDLSLTDANGKLVARKALAAGEFRPVATVLQPGAELALQTRLSARDARVTGYTVEIFYP